MYIDTYICICIYTYLYTHTHRHRHRHTQTHTHVHACIYACCIHTYENVYTCYQQPAPLLPELYANADRLSVAPRAAATACCGLDFSVL